MELITPKEKEKKALNARNLFFSFAVVFLFFFGIKGHYHISINSLTDSLPHLFYIIESGSDFKRNNYIEFEYKSEHKMYFKNGSRFIKKVVGMPGDKITFHDNIFYINDFPFGQVKELARDGKKLVSNTNKVLEKNEYFVFSPHKDSFDSRYVYVGYVKKKQVLGKVVFKFWRK